MDTYALEKLTNWTPELSPPRDSPLFPARVLAGVGARPLHIAALADDRDSQVFQKDVISGMVRRTRPQMCTAHLRFDASHRPE